MSKKLGGVEPAFPNNDPHGPQGMSLRDYFAAKALAGLCAAHTSDGQWSAVGLYEQSAEEAYLFADAMLSVRAALSNSERTGG